MRRFYQSLLSIHAGVRSRHEMDRLVWRLYIKELRNCTLDADELVLDPNENRYI
ncbi:MAG: hypothetical protein HC862_24595 [Scytonema sp. RU_4_4]|nr:hypothetical protein [Scytonema sp. RU_4_4]NJR74263.1 hypothetical protein [Scytonema sp. CRU_2_7]